MKKYKVWVEFEREIEADNREEAKKIFREKYLESPEEYISLIKSRRILKNLKINSHSQIATNN